MRQSSIRPLPRGSRGMRVLILFAVLGATPGLAACAAAAPVSAPAVSVPSPSPNEIVPLAGGGDTPAPVSTVVPSCPNSAGSNPLASYRPPSTMPAPGNMPAGSAMREIQQRGYLIAGVDEDQFQISARNLAPAPPRGEEYQGFDIDVLHALAAAIFGSSGADNIRYVPVIQGYRMGAAYQGLVDVVADSITITCGRWAQVNFSVDYVDAGQELLVPRADAGVSVTLDSNRVPHVHGLAGGKVCTVGSTTSQGNLGALEASGGFGVVIAKNWSDCIVMLQQGQVRAMSTDDTVLRGILREDAYLKVVGDEFSYEPHGLAFPRADPTSARGNARPCGS